MRFTHFMRDMIWLILGVLVTAICIFSVSNNFMTKGFDASFQKEITTIRTIVDDMIDKKKSMFLLEASQFSISRDLDKLFLKHDFSSLQHITKNAMLQCNANIAVIVDINGNVLCRGHSNQYGDTIYESAIIKNALSGKSLVDIVHLKNYGLSVLAVSPIFIDKKLVGAIAFGEAFQKHAFVDEVNRLTGFDMTIFEKKKRLSTTIVRDGKRAVDTDIENSDIVATVLERGRSYTADANILGHAYKTVYWPIRDSIGVIHGMWFLGMEVDDVQRTITSVALSCLVATLIIAAVLSLLGGAYIHSLFKPLHNSAYVDKLTGASNRAGFENEIERIFANGCRPGCLFLIDLDNFKTLNDTLGHPVGDECLKRTGSVLRETFRKTDLVARLGGDEFVVYSPNLDSKDVIEDKLRGLLHGLTQEYSAGSGTRVTVTASIGVAMSHDDSADYKRMYTTADAALYTSKKNGRNCFNIMHASKDDL